jgi:hypothetical protein|tara:strand:+ start:126 stop:353 length:228 start_codon:yes stop_codon:yes gene_type:complete
MEEEVTYEELKTALFEWKKKFELVRREWEDASVEDQIKILSFLEDKAKKTKEDGKIPMGFNVNEDWGTQDFVHPD